MNSGEFRYNKLHITLSAAALCNRTPLQRVHSITDTFNIAIDDWDADMSRWE